MALSGQRAVGEREFLSCSLLLTSKCVCAHHSCLVGSGVF